MNLARANKILEGTGITVVGITDYEGQYPRKMYHWEDQYSLSRDFRTIREVTGDAVKYYLSKKG